jgi:hypothetical protein
MTRWRRSAVADEVRFVKAIQMVTANNNTSVRDNTYGCSRKPCIKE